MFFKWKKSQRMRVCTCKPPNEIWACTVACRNDWMLHVTLKGVGGGRGIELICLNLLQFVISHMWMVIWLEIWAGTFLWGGTDSVQICIKSSSVLMSNLLYLDIIKQLANEKLLPLLPKYWWQNYLLSAKIFNLCKLFIGWNSQAGNFKASMQ